MTTEGCSQKERSDEAISHEYGLEIVSLLLVARNNRFLTVVFITIIQGFES